MAKNKQKKQTKHMREGLARTSSLSKEKDKKKTNLYMHISDIQKKRKKENTYTNHKTLFLAY